MRIAYFDLIAGISGDMTVAAFLALGLPRRRLEEDLRKLEGVNFRLRIGKKSVSGVTATRFHVISGEDPEERSWKTIKRLIERSALERSVKDRALCIFSRLAAVEGKIHGVPREEVHFHEVGAVDSIVDIVAAAIATCYFDIDSFACSVIPVGHGLTRSRHGVLPVPAPATLELLKGFTVEGAALQGENVTPTGAAILAGLAAQSGDMPQMSIEKVGYGAGEKKFPDRPNLLRVLLGEQSTELGRDRMLVMETNIDDLNPELYDYVIDRLFAVGARDVSLSPIQMKKNRPGTLLRIIAEPATRKALADVVLSETSTIGIRCYPVERITLPREAGKVETRFGRVRVKIVEEPGGRRRATPEYEDIKRIAAEKKVPLKLLYDEVARNFEGGVGAKRTKF